MKRSSFLIIIFIITSIQLGFAAPMTKQAIEQRIKPVSQVNVMTPEAKKAEQKTVAKQEQLENNQQVKTVETKSATTADKQMLAQGEKIYNSYCMACHNTGAANAPKIGDEKAWKQRADVNGIDKLVENAIKGYKMMPPKGTCMTCSDAEIKAAVLYILSKSHYDANKEKGKGT